MHMLYQAGTLNRRRPYWHVDMKWVASLFCMLAIIVTLPIVALTLLTQRSTATNIITYTLVGLTSPAGIDSSKGLEDLQKKVTQEGEHTLSVGGAKVTFTQQDIQNLSPRELRLKAFSGFAQNFYDLGPYELAKETGASSAEAKKFQEQSTSISIFTARWHTHLTRLLVWMVLADVVLILVAVLFSYRFGRLATPGVILATAGAPAVPLMAWAQTNSQPMGTARPETVTGTLDAAEAFAQYVGPLAIPTIANVYRGVLLVGLGLLALAFSSALVYHIARRRKRAKNRQAGHHQGQDEA